jgi:peroxiredoxin Q/BCP
MRNHQLVFVLTTSFLSVLYSGCAVNEKPDVDAALARRPRVAPPSPRGGLIPTNRPAPNFDAVDQTGQYVMLSELLQRKKVVLIFYPADFTPGCTRQLCNVRDAWSEFQRRGAIVVGINPAKPSRHAEFAETHGFPFPVLSDPGGVISAGYGAGGGDPERPKRTVYVIRRDRKVAMAEYGMVPHERIYTALDRP